jgi:hypothetical protein
MTLVYKQLIKYGRIDAYMNGRKSLNDAFVLCTVSFITEPFKFTYICKYMWKKDTLYCECPLSKMLGPEVFHIS